MLVDNLFQGLSIIVAIVVVAGILQAARPRWSLVVVADQHGLRSCRGVAKVHQATLGEFFKKEVALQSRIKIRGRRQKDGLLRLHVDGAIDAGSRQRIRNFLLALL